MFKKIALRLSTILIAAIATSLILSAGTSFAADRYWVGSGGNTSDTANWSTSSAGGGGASVPSTSDIAYFDSGGGDATVNVTLSVNSLQLLADYTGTITQTDAVSAATISQAAGILNGGTNSLATTSTFTISGGTYTAGTGTITTGGVMLLSGTGTFDASNTTLLDLNGAGNYSGANYSLRMASASASFTAPSGTMKVFYSLGLASGTFDPNGGTIEMDGQSGIIDVNATETFYNLNLNKNNGVTVTIASNDVITVENLLTLTNGMVNLLGSSRIESVDSSTAGDADVSVASTFDGGTGDIRFKGTTDFSIPAGAVLPSVTLNNSSLTITTTGSGTVRFDNKLTITDGDFDNIGDVNITVDAAYTQIAGNFYPGDGTVLSIYSINISAGTFDASTDTPTSLAVTSNQSTVSINVTGTGTLDISNITTVTVAGLFFIEGSGIVDASNVTTLDLNGAYNYSGANYSFRMASASASFTAPSGTMKVYYSLGLASGTFDPNGGTVEMDGQSGIIDVNATETFYNLNINKANGVTLTISSNDVITVENLLTLTNGMVNLSGSSRIESIDSATAGDADVSIASTFDGGTGDIRFKGTTDFSIPGGAVLPSVTLNNSSLTVTTTGSGTIKFDNKLTITDGDFDNTGDVNITVDAAYTQVAGTFYPGEGTVLSIYSINISAGTFDASTDAPTSLTVTSNQSTVSINVTGTGTLDISNITTVTVAGLFFIEGSGIVDASNVTTLDLNGAYNYSGANYSFRMASASASFTAPSGTMKVYYSLGLASGTFDPNGGTVEMDGQSGIIDVNATETFYNLNINKANGVTLTISSNDVITVDNLLTLTNGKVNLSGSSRIESIDSATAGDADVSVANTFDGGTGDIRFKGTTDFSIPAGAILPSVTLNNSLLTITTTGSGTVRFDNKLTLTNGDFDNIGDVNITVDTAYTQESGTFYPGDGTVLSIYSINISAGTFDTSTDTPTSLTVTSGQSTVGILATGNGTLDISNIGTVTVAGLFLIKGSAIVDASNVTTLDLNGAFNYPSGSYPSANYSTTANYSFVMDSSTANFTAPSGTMTIFYSLGLAVGTFDPNGGTVEMDGQSGVIDINATETFYNLTINKVSGVPVTIASNDVVTVENLLTLTNGKINLLGSSRIESIDSSTAGDADVSVASTFDGGTGDIRFKGTTDFSISAGAILPSVTLNNSLLTITTTGTGTVKFDNKLTLTNGDFDNTGDVNITVDTAYTQVAGTFYPGDGTVLSIYSINISGGTFGDITDSPSSLTVTSGQSTVAILATGNGTLDISNITTVTSAGLLLIKGDGIVDASNVTTLDLNGAVSYPNGSYPSSNYSTAANYSFVMDSSTANFTAPSGTMHIYYSLGLAVGTLDSNLGTVEMDGQSGILDVNATETLYNLTVNKVGGQPVTLRSSVDIDGDLLISSGILSASGYQITLAGDWTNNSTFTHLNNTVTLDGTDQTIGGSVNTTFYNLTKSVTAADTLSFANGTTTTISNTTVLEGTSGNQLTLNSDLEGSQWSLNAAVAGRTINYVSVQDSNNTSGTDIDLTDGGAGEYGIDLLNNLNWILSAAPLPSSPAVPEFTTWLYIIGMMLTGGYFYRERIFEAVQVS